MWKKYKYRYGIEYRFSKIFEVEAETLEEADKIADKLVDEDIEKTNKIIWKNAVDDSQEWEVYDMEHLN